MPTNDSHDPGGRPKVDRTGLERAALALGLIEQTARRLRSELDEDLAAAGSLGRELAGNRAAAAFEASRHIAQSIEPGSSLDASKILELGESLVRTDAGVIASADGWIAVASIEPRSAAA